MRQIDEFNVDDVKTVQRFNEINKESANLLAELKEQLHSSLSQNSLKEFNVNKTQFSEMEFS